MTVNKSQVTVEGLLLRLPDGVPSSRKLLLEIFFARCCRQISDCDRKTLIIFEVLEEILPNRVPWSDRVSVTKSAARRRCTMFVDVGTRSI
jgi:hypothetical protein